MDGRVVILKAMEMQAPKGLEEVWSVRSVASRLSHPLPTLHTTDTSDMDLGFGYVFGPVVLGHPRIKL